MSRLEVFDLAKSFGGLAALDGVDMQVDAGEVVGLLGPNGAGKTTLFNCLAGVERPDRGRILLDGVDVSGLPVHERARRGMARTFQRAELFGDLTVADHVALALRAKDRRGSFLGWPWPGGGRAGVGAGPGRVDGGGGADGGAAGGDGLAGGGRRVARREEAVRVAAVLERFGLEHQADLPGRSLPLARARMVELARAVASEPSVVLADEPSSGLDGGERATLAATLAAVAAAGTAVLLVEHDLDLVRQVASRVYVLGTGHLVSAGPTEEILAQMAGVAGFPGRPASGSATQPRAGPPPGRGP